MELESCSMYLIIQEFFHVHTGETGIGAADQARNLKTTSQARSRLLAGNQPRQAIV